MNTEPLGGQIRSSPVYKRTLRARNQVISYFEGRRKPAEGNTAEALIAYDGEPTTFDEAIKAHDAEQWRKAMDEEYASLLKNQTWILADLPTGRKPIKCKWVYKIKCRIDGSIERYKARLVAKGFSQKQGIDYTETFSPVVRMDSVRLLLSIAAKENLELKHFDVKTAWLYERTATLFF